MRRKGGRAPGWRAGVVLAQRADAQAAVAADADQQPTVDH